MLLIVSFPRDFTVPLSRTLSFFMTRLLGSTYWA